MTPFVEAVVKMVYDENRSVTEVAQKLSVDPVRIEQALKKYKRLQRGGK